MIRRKKEKAEAVKEKVDQVDTLPPTDLVLSFTNHFVAFNCRNLEPRQLEPKGYEAHAVRLVPFPHGIPQCIAGVRALAIATNHIVLCYCTKEWESASPVCIHALLASGESS